MGDVLFFAAYHEQQYGIAFDVPQEAGSYSLAFVGSFYYTRNIGHHERTVVVIADYSQIGLQGCKSVRSNLWLGRSNGAQQCGFTGVRESYQPHIRQELEFQNENAFFALFTGLGVARCLVGCGLKVVVAKAAFAAAAEDLLLSVFIKVEELLSALGILYHGANRYIQYYICAILAFAQCGAAFLPVFGLDMLAVFQVDQCPELRAGPQDDMPAAASVSSVWPAFGNVLGSVQVHGARPSVSGSAVNLYVVYKVTISHNCCFERKVSDSF